MRSFQSVSILAMHGQYMLFHVILSVKRSMTSINTTFKREGHDMSVSNMSYKITRPIEKVGRRTALPFAYEDNRLDYRCSRFED